MRNYYEILEVDRKASKDTINKIFKIHMKANHPDLFKDEEKKKAEEKSKVLTEAYNILSDENERVKYDLELKETEELSNTNNIHLQQALEENEYLRRMLENKNLIIARLSNVDPNLVDDYINAYSTPTAPTYNNTGFNGFTPKEQNPYEGYTLEELQKIKKEEQKAYYMRILKENGIKVIVLIIILIALLISVGQSISDLKSMF